MVSEKGDALRQYRDTPLQALGQMAGRPGLTTQADPDGSFLLHWATGNMDADVIRELLAAGVDVEARDRTAQATPLRWAARAGPPHAVEILFDYGAELNARDVGHATPLHSAAGFNALDTVNTLIGYGAKVNEPDGVGETSLHWAARWQQDPMVTEVLLEFGADPYRPAFNGVTPFQLAKASNPLHAIVFEKALSRPLN